MDNKKEQRMVRMLELLDAEPSISVKSFAEKMNVSEMTIRRDLETMRKNHLIERTHGKAALIRGGNEFTVDGEIYDLRKARIQNLSEKDSIAKYAASLLEPGDLVFLDNGTTVSRMAAYLPSDFELTVLCCSFQLLSELLKHPNINTIFPGGYYHPEDQSFTANEAVSFIRRHRASKAFISASGVHKALGITSINSHSVPNKVAMMESSAQVFLLADSTKFGRVKNNHFAELSDLDGIITDSKIDSDWADIIRVNNLILHTV